jgi:hypothetical protein
MSEPIDEYARFLDPEFCPDLEFLFRASELIAGAQKLRSQLDASDRVTLDTIIEQISGRANQVDQGHLAAIREESPVAIARGDAYESTCAYIAQALGSDAAIVASHITISEHRVYLMRAHKMSVSAQLAPHQYEKQQFAVDLYKMWDVVQEARKAFSDTPEAQSGYHLGMVLHLLYLRTLESAQRP